MFLYSEMTAPLPCAGTAGVWTAYPGVHSLVAHLRFGLLPLDFATWLSRDEWDSAPREPKTAEMLFEGAQAANNRRVADFPLMKKVIAQLDAALETTDEAVAWRKLQMACRIFNSRWESTPTWNFAHKPFRDIRALLKDMTARESIDDEQKRELKSLATQSLSDPKTQRRRRALLKKAAVC